MISSLVACACLVVGPGASSPRPPAPDTSLVVSVAWLAAHRSDPGVVVIVIGHDDSDYRSAHIPGARFVGYHQLAPDVNGISSELPGPDVIRRLFEAVGVSDDSHVILTGPPLFATRAFFTLDYFGLRQVSILAGGLPRWRAAGLPVETGAPPASRSGHLTPHLRPVVASADYVLGRIGKRGFAFIDTRTEEEYLGTGYRHGATIAGHIEGARRLEWQDLFTDPGEFTPRSVPELARMWSRLAAPGDSVVTYCMIGYRGSGSYFVSRYLGYPVRLYDGSYEEWSRRRLPLVTAVTPPLGGSR